MKNIEDDRGLGGNTVKKEKYQKYPKCWIEAWKVRTKSYGEKRVEKII